MNYINRPVFGYTYYGAESFINGIYYKSNPSRGIIGYETKSGISNPDWETEVQKRLNASTAYTRTYFKPEQEGYFDISAKKLNSKDWTRTWGYVASMGPLAGGWSWDDSVTRDIAVSKIKRKIQSDKDDFAVLTNLVQDVYEFQRTIHGTLDALHNLLLDFLHIIGRRRRGGTRGVLRSIADLYLGYVFGINPSIQDAIALGKSIQSFIDRKDHTKRFQASHYSDASKGQNTTFNPIHGISLTLNEEIHRRYSCKYISGHKFDLLSGNNYGLIDHFHLMPWDFIPMLWELLPWSWVIDYVVNIGPFLDDWFQSDIDSSYYDVQCIQERRSYHNTIVVKPSSGWAITNKVIKPRVVNCGTFTRTPLVTLPGRMLRFRTRYEIDSNLDKKVLNLIAVAATKTLR